MNAPMLSISGATPESIAALSSAVLAVLASGAEQKTLRVALEVLAKGVQAPSNTSITGCTFLCEPEPPQPVAKRARK